MAKCITVPVCSEKFAVGEHGVIAAHLTSQQPMRRGA